MKASFKKIPSQYEILLGTVFEGNRSVECPCSIKYKLKDHLSFGLKFNVPVAFLWSRS